MSKKQITVSIYLTTFIGMFLITARSIILPSILTELNAYNYYNFAIILNSFAMCVVLPISGKISDIYGRKRIYVFGAAGYVAACIICFLSKNVFIFLIGLMLTGVFFGLMNSVQLAILFHIHEKEKHFEKVSNINIANSIACLSAPVIAGYFTDYISWRVVYLVVIPFSIYILYTLFKYLPKDDIANSRKHEIDVYGAFYFVAAFMPALLLLSGAKLGVYKNLIFAFFIFILSLIFLTLLIKEEKKAKQPIIPIKLFKNNLYFICIIAYLIGSIGFAAMNYLPLYYQGIKNLSVLISGCLILPRQISQIVVGIVLKRKTRKVNVAIKLLIYCFMLFLVNFIIMAQFNKDTSIIIIVGAEVLFGILNGAITILSQAYCARELAFDDIGSGTAFMGFIGAFGYTIGSGIGGVILSFNIEITNQLRLIFLSFGFFMTIGCLFCIYYYNKRENKIK